jgi:hypothetical protein
MRFINEMDKEAHKKLLLNPVLRARDILEYASLGLLLKFQENKDYSDYNDVFLLVMSHRIRILYTCVPYLEGR